MHAFFINKALFHRHTSNSTVNYWPLYVLNYINKSSKCTLSLFDAQVFKKNIFFAKIACIAMRLCSGMQFPCVRCIVIILGTMDRQCNGPADTQTENRKCTDKIMYNNVKKVNGARASYMKWSKKKRNTISTVCSFVFSSKVWNDILRRLKTRHP